MTVAGYFAIWEFHVRPEFRADFEPTYGPTGAWAQLFRSSPDYLGTNLLRDPHVPERYLTIDRWKSHSAFLDFKRQHASAYAELDRQCERFTQLERCLGEFDLLSIGG